MHLQIMNKKSLFRVTSHLMQALMNISSYFFHTKFTHCICLFSMLLISFANVIIYCETNANIEVIIIIIMVIFRSYFSREHIAHSYKNDVNI